MRTCLTVITMCCLTSAVGAQLIGVMPDTRPTMPADVPMSVKLTVPVMAAPDPALKYQLLPTLLDKTEGNAVLMYYLAQQAMSSSLNPQTVGKDREQITKYLEMPLSDLPQKEVAALLSNYSTVLRQIEIGSMRKNADWGLAHNEGARMLLPTFGDFRHMARVLAVRARLEIAQGHIDKAVSTIRTGMAMARHMGDGPLISSLVGIAIESMMLDRVQELISLGGPNMYWALASLPEPLVDVRPGLDYERQFGLTTPEIRKAWSGPVGPAEGAAMLRRMSELFSEDGASYPGPGSIGYAAAAARYYAAGKRMLIARGSNPKEVEAMPVGQVLALYFMFDYMHWVDELYKWSALPYPQAQEGYRRTQREFQEWFSAEGRLNPATRSIPSLGRASFIQARLDRARAALQTIESIRAYAARHGKAPQTLDQLDLPAPIDPVTGKAFGYTSQGNKFTLVGSMPQGESARDGVRYEVSLTPAAAAHATAPAPTTMPSALQADAAWQGIEPFIQDGTLAVFHIDLAALTSDAAWQQFTTLAKEAKLPDEALKELATARKMTQRYVDAGAANVFVVVDVTDIPDTPMIVVPLGRDVNFDKLATMLQPFSHRSQAHKLGGALVLATENQLHLLAETGGTKRPRLVKALNFTRGQMGVAVALSDNVRRALNESLGTLPPELGSMPGATITQGFEWAGAALTITPEMTIEVVIQAADAAAANRMSTMIDSGLQSLVKEAQGTPGMSDFIKAIIKSLPLSVKGDQLILKMKQAQILSQIRQTIVPALNSVAQKQAAWWQSRLNIQAIIKACNAWAGAHDGVFPPDLQTLVKAKLLAEQTLVNPMRPELGQAGYVYLRPSVPVAQMQDPSHQVVIYEAHEQLPPGVSIGFADGHVETLLDQFHFDRLVKNSQASQPASQPATGPTSKASGGR